MSELSFPILPPAWLGVMGGGQLGRMFCHAAQSMGYKVCVLDPDEASPAGAAADMHLKAPYLDEVALARMAKLCQAVTTEFENVPAKALEFLAHRCRVSPSATAVSVAQDRVQEKRFAQAAGARVAPFAAITSESELAAADVNLFPAILKSSQLGYDGKGQARVANPAEAIAAFKEMKKVPCVLEKMLDLAMEVSVIVARSSSGSVALMPVAENEHRNGILARTMVPARISIALEAQVKEAAISIARALDYVGVLCVEFFIVHDGGALSWVVNEMAPRPHNSGHYSVNACITSQFEQQVRAMAQLPLGDSALLSPSVMINLLGDIWPASGEPAWDSLLKHPLAKLHLYGKAHARPARKMGHITLVGGTLDELIFAATGIEKNLGITGN